MCIRDGPQCTGSNLLLCKVQTLVSYQWQIGNDEGAINYNMTDDARHARNLFA